MITVKSVFQGLHIFNSACGKRIDLLVFKLLCVLQRRNCRVKSRSLNYLTTILSTHVTQCRLEGMWKEADMTTLGIPT
jgi:hypothetical protein